MSKPSPKTCPDCDVKPGSRHKLGCDVERCYVCGDQFIGCNCDEAEIVHDDRLPWTGEWPGVAECREYGLWAKLVVNRGWVACGKDDPEASPDLNALCFCRWDKKLGKRLPPKEGAQALQRRAHGR